MYESYIITDQIWTPQLPAHWKYRRGKSIFDTVKEKNEGNKESNLLSLTLKGVIHNSKDNPIGLSPADYATYQIFEANDLVFKLIDLENVSTSRVGIVPERGIMSSAYIRLFARKDINIRYFYYQFHDWWLRQIFNGLGAGVRQTLSAQDLLNLKLAIPPREEQDQIVRYLDWKVSSINRLIRGYQQQIKLLEEYKKSQISHLVTHGIKNHEMVDSEIYWLESVPKKWRVTRLKHILKKQQRPIPENAELLICSNSGEVKKRGESKMGLVAESDDIYQGVKQGDLLIHGMDTWHGAIAVSDFDGMCTPVVHVCTSKESVRFVAYYLKMMAYTKVFKAISNGVRQNTSDFRSWDKTGALYIALPSLEEQEAISDRIDIAIKKINNSISVINREIDSLKEYCTRLISDIVTGQVDVRGVEIPDYTPEEGNTIYEEIDNKEEVSDSAY